MPLVNPRKSANLLVSTYTGDGTSPRHITTGFQCAVVILVQTTDHNRFYVCTETTNTLELNNAPNIYPGSTTVYLDGSNGFYVKEDGASFWANTSGKAYHYVAIST